MISKESVRVWLNIEDRKGPHAPKVNDEEILNVLRREGEGTDSRQDLTTKEIAEDLPVVRKTVSNRLKGIEGERVEKRTTGSADMWRLAEGEVENPVNPDLGVVVEHSSWARRKSREVKAVGIDLCKLGFVLFLVGLTAMISAFEPPVVSSSDLLAFAYVFGVVGGGTIGGSAVMWLSGVVAPKLVEEFLLD